MLSMQSSGESRSLKALDSKGVFEQLGALSKSGYRAHLRQIMNGGFVFVSLNKNQSCTGNTSHHL
jgi:hypothetical protein